MNAAVFSALGDPVRLEIVSRLSRGGPQTTSALLEGLGLTRQGAARHLVTLERCGLVQSKPLGRVVVRELSSAPLRGSAEWIEKLARDWDDRLAKLEDQYR